MRTGSATLWPLLAPRELGNVASTSWHFYLLLISVKNCTTLVSNILAANTSQGPPSIPRALQGADRKHHFTLYHNYLLLSRFSLSTAHASLRNTPCSFPPTHRTVMLLYGQLLRGVRHCHSCAAQRGESWTGQSFPGRVGSQKY